MTAPEVFRNGLQGTNSDVEVLQYSLGHNVNAGAKVVECFWEVHHADGDRDDGASWIASLNQQKVSNYFHNGVTLVVTSSSILG